jgi:Mce-associated membrane protein
VVDVDVTPRGESTRALSVLAGLLAVAFLVILGFRVFGGSDADPPPPVTHERAIVAAARAATTAFLDVDYSDMAPRMAKVLSLATGTFYDRYKAAEDQLEAVSTEGRVKSRGTVRYVGVARAASRTALVYVAADSTVTNTRTTAIDPTGTTGEKRRYRFRVQLVLVGSNWRVDGLEFVR